MQVRIPKVRNGARVSTHREKQRDRTAALSRASPSSGGRLPRGDRPATARPVQLQGGLQALRRLASHMCAPSRCRARRLLSLLRLRIGIISNSISSIRANT